MCGIVGLFIKDPALEPELGRLTAGMLEKMTERGPDSAGFAVYGAGVEGQTKVTLRGASAEAIKATVAAIKKAIPGAEAALHDNHAVVSVPTEDVARLDAWLAEDGQDTEVVGRGTRMEIFKEVGLPADVAERFGLSTMSGTHAIGHTRMATESAVTTDGAHPYSTGKDQCLVHNGSLSNHNNVRRNLRREGMTFETQNDTEVAAGYLTWRMHEGLSLGDALEVGLEDLDGFYTFVVGTENGFGVLRDGIACKPAVMAETDQYVAFGSEYRVLADLPGIGQARVWEPEPATVYFWER
ncbi:MAG: glutamine amidotransferase family protein [Methyloceanibacter sp.]|uniref:class II glutamine amidotransferase n=1 Tax=Methyloceanibacter sp. TaxID=1965321 RepID=UPI001DA0EAF7|nr:glutamine amidotransferase family protein [Methyloceanibacter sp.]MCB1441707.1 glutamine amidotransferase family protein [Methyloceanibacter sp.]MCC0059015.1 glutamine amidotransferase family protein [Hyphomicrobiaceae bacterium]